MRLETVCLVRYVCVESARPDRTETHGESGPRPGRITISAAPPPVPRPVRSTLPVARRDGRRQPPAGRARSPTSKKFPFVFVRYPILYLTVWYGPVLRAAFIYNLVLSNLYDQSLLPDGVRPFETLLISSL